MLPVSRLTHRVAERLKSLRPDLTRIQGELDDIKLMTGQHFFALRPADTPLDQAAYKVFSQFGEDGILDAIVRQAARPVPRSFVEIGVEDYRESNTRFLCESGGWRGLIVDAGDEHAAFAKRRMLSIHRQLVTRQTFVTTANADALLVDAGFGGEVGVLSLDVDGVDYWLAQAMMSVNPAVVIVEHNPYWGPEAAVTVPYEDAFVRREKHPSGVYYGASIQAWSDLWKGRGYRLAAVSPEGLNLFFVRDDYCPDSWALDPAEAWTPPEFSPYAASDGAPAAMLPLREARRPIEHMPLTNVQTGGEVAVRDLG